MQLQITHQTQYRYVAPVQMAQHIACMRPRQHAMQHLQEHALQVQPDCALLREYTDAFGNWRTYFSLQQAHTELTVIANSVVHTRSVALPLDPEATTTWEAVQNALRYESHKAAHPAAAFVYPSPYVAHAPAFLEFARPCFAPETPLLQAAIELMQRIHRECQYESHSTQINTPAAQALAQRKGVCQDFAHIFLACWRSMGLPARYVSGYLVTSSAADQVQLVGSDASHAWVSVYLPDLTEVAPEQRWVDLDPTNDRWGWHNPGADYITVAFGRDFGDVSPLRGVIHGGGKHQLSVGVTVTVLDTEGQSLRQSAV